MITRERLEEIHRGDWGDRKAFMELLETVGELLPVLFDEPLSQAELKRDYPALYTLLGEKVSIRRVTGHAMSRAHMIFAPDIERALAAALKQKLWEQFAVSVRLRRKRRQAKEFP